MTQLRVRYRHWVPRVLPNCRAIVLYPYILFRYGPADVTDKTRRHELEHVYQVRRAGWLRFYVRYLFRLMRYGYRDHPDEIEARLAALEPLTPIEREIFR